MSGEIQILGRSVINVERWNKCIQQNSNGQIYALTFYLDVLCPNWKGIVIGDYEGVFPLTWRKKFGIKYLYQPFFCQQLGLFGSGDHLPEILKLLSKKYRHVDIQLNKNCISGDLRTRNNFILDLNRDYLHISAQYSKQLKRNLKRAKKHNLKFQKSKDFSRSIEFFKENKGRELKGLDQRDYRMFRELCQVVEKEAEAFTIDAISGQNIEGTAVIFNSKEQNRLTLIMLSSTGKGRDIGASSFLIDEMIKLYSGQNIVLDFEGSSIPGLIRFYRGFGSTNEPYPVYKKSLIPFK